ncbi:protein DEEPER ROOTING 1-like [Lycium ferocissimum]|uniref:protein DEEPER ROOTING 1-like n=1 Tax=Lycium ferocissimum TaxID=112874 RepID=UPI0028162282|nr:protein DEEPER ROOTING 1-like [Lycium ferocissimum]
MKIFNWIQSKINGKQSTYKSNPVAITHHMLHQPCKEEFSDWPNELLAIGTFGNLKDSSNLNQPTCRPDHQPDQSLTPEEVGQLHKELKHLFQEESTPLSANGSKKDLEKFFNCLQNLVEDDQQVLENKESNFKRSNSLVRGRGQESAQLENTNNGISKKSLSYLLKKTFFCSSGFTPPPPHPLRDPVLPQSSKFEKSRMEKILRAILQKKIYPQATSPRGTTTRKRYLDNRGVIESDSEDEAFETVKNNGSKWDKSDSDFIVLEI